MSKKRKCYRCRQTAPTRPNGQPEAFERGDGRWLCGPCLVLLMYDADVQARNKLIDDYLEVAKRHHAAHVVVNLDCPFCALEVR